jgi:hypothetical protein
MLLAARVLERIDLENEVGSEGCPACLPASGAVAVVRPNRPLRQLILNRSAEAASCKSHAFSRRQPSLRPAGLTAPNFARSPAL